MVSLMLTEREFYVSHVGRTTRGAKWRSQGSVLSSFLLNIYISDQSVLIWRFIHANDLALSVDRNSNGKANEAAEGTGESR